jgi:hypothetical protein
MMFKAGKENLDADYVCPWDGENIRKYLEEDEADIESGDELDTESEDSTNTENDGEEEMESNHSVEAESDDQADMDGEQDMEADDDEANVGNEHSMQTLVMRGKGDQAY